MSRSKYTFDCILLLGVFFLLITGEADAQFYSKHVSLYPEVNSYIGAMNIANDTINAICYSGDSSYPGVPIIAFERFTKQGERISYNALDTSPLQGVYANGSLIRTRDNGFAFACYQSISSTVNEIILLKFDHEGLLQWYRPFVDSHCVTFDNTELMQDSSENFYITGLIQQNNSDPGSIFVVKSDSAGNWIYRKILVYPGMEHLSGTICINRKSNILIGGVGLIDNPPTYTSIKGYTEIFELDTAGNVLNHILGTDTSGPSVGANIILTNDGGYITAGDYDHGTNNSGAIGQGCIFKLDSNFNEQWRIIAGPISNFTGFGRILRIGQNYIAAGQWKNDSDAVSRSFGWLLMFDSQGQTIWSRRYEGFHGQYGDNNNIYSIGLFSDTTIICAGDIITTDSIIPDQQGWLLHLDTTGCLPDSMSCGVIAGIHEIAMSNLSISVFPNPATNHLSIIVSESEPEERIGLSIYNNWGQDIYHTSETSPQKDYTLDVSDWLSGLYHYRAMTSKGYTASGTFIVLH